MSNNSDNQGSPPKHPGGRPPIGKRKPERHAELARELAQSGERVLDVLEPLPQKFVLEFLVDHNVSRAADRCGLTKQRGHQIMQDPLVELAIGEEIEDRRQRMQVTADRVVTELAAVAFSDITDYVDIKRGGRSRIKLRDLSRIPVEKRRAIAELVESRSAAGGHKVSFKLHDKMKALRMLCDHLGIAVQRQILQGDAEGGPVKYQHDVTPLPPAPKTIEEWEAQVRAAEARRLPAEGSVPVDDVQDQDSDSDSEASS